MPVGYTLLTKVLGIAVSNTVTTEIVFDVLQMLKKQTKKRNSNTAINTILTTMCRSVSHEYLKLEKQEQEQEEEERSFLYRCISPTRVHEQTALYKINNNVHIKT